MMQCALFFGLFAMGAAQTPCASPLQWESKIVKSFPGKSFIEVGKFSYDAVNERIRTVEEVMGQQKEYYDVLWLYKENKEYRLNLKTKTCTVGVPPYPFFKVAIPPNATFLFEFDLGAAPSPGTTQKQQAWESNLAGGAKYGIFVSVPSCVPVSAFYNSRNFSFYETYNYYDVTAGIKDPSVFTPPAECSGLLESNDSF